MSWFGVHPDDRTPGTSTPGEAHAEWHRNARVPMGTPGCPQDACHDDPDDGACDHGDLFSECAPCQAAAATAQAAWQAEQQRIAAQPLTEPPF